MFTPVTENVRRMNGAIQGETTFSSVQRAAGLTSTEADVSRYVGSTLHDLNCSSVFGFSRLVDGLRRDSRCHQGACR